MGIATQFALSVLVAGPVGYALIMWTTWRIPMGGRIVGDWFLLPLAAFLFWTSARVLNVLGLDGDAELSDMIAGAALRLWRGLDP